MNEPTSGQLQILDVDVQTADHEAGDGAVLLDVREQQEWDAGHAPQALHVPLSSLEAAALPPGPVLAICRSGNRSGVAAQQLADAGVDVRNVAGGMLAWAEAGLPMATSGPHAEDEPAVV